MNIIDSICLFKRNIATFVPSGYTNRKSGDSVVEITGFPEVLATGQEVITEG
ncbi:MAG: hypothetical protein LC649_01685 [Bacteroidales bacterium]|nr:hypothetical protein [Bacteroidales bacterium]